MNHPLEKRHETFEVELATGLASIEKMREILSQAQRTAFALESQNGKGSDAAVGKARRQITHAEKALRELGDRHAKLAAEELATRYALAEENLTRERRTNEELKERETSLTTRLAFAAEQMAQAEAQLSDQGARGRRLAFGPLKNHVEGRAREALALVTKAKKKVKELTDQLTQARGAHQESITRLAFLAARLEETLGLGESHLRVLNGSLEKIRAQLADPHVTVDRLALEELLAKWAQGFTERMQDYLKPARTATFYVREVWVYYWFDTGAIAATAILGCDDGQGTEWPRSLRHANFDDAGTRRLLEAERAGAPS